jgi:hypothetical protein
MEKFKGNQFRQEDIKLAMGPKVIVLLHDYFLPNLSFSPKKIG